MSSSPLRPPPRPPPLSPSRTPFPSIRRTTSSSTEPQPPSLCFFVPSVRVRLMGGWVWRRGHGTSDQDGEVVATLCGVVERVNKLVYVRTLRARYARAPAFFLSIGVSILLQTFRPPIFTNRTNTLNCVVNLLACKI